MVELEKYVTCEVREDGSWVTNPSPWVKEYLAKLAGANGLSLKEVRERIFLEGFSLAYIERDEKGKIEIIKRELPDGRERPVVVFGRRKS